MNFDQTEIYRTGLPATEVVFYYMHGCHVFTRLQGDTLDAILADTDRVVNLDPGGMLCQPTLLHGDIELRRVGINIHHREKDPDGWAKAQIAWHRAAGEDTELVALMSGESPTVHWTTEHSLDALLELLLKLGRTKVKEIIMDNGLAIEIAGQSADLLKSKIIAWAARQKLAGQSEDLTWSFKV